MQDGWKKEIAEVLQELRIKEKVRKRDVTSFTLFSWLEPPRDSIVRYSFDAALLCFDEDNKADQCVKLDFSPDILKFYISLHFHALLCYRAGF